MPKARPTVAGESGFTALHVKRAEERCTPFHVERTMTVLVPRAPYPVPRAFDFDLSAWPLQSGLRARLIQLMTCTFDACPHTCTQRWIPQKVQPCRKAARPHEWSFPRAPGPSALS